MNKRVFKIVPLMMAACLTLTAAMPLPPNLHNLPAFSLGQSGSGVHISFDVPKGWYTKEARVGIRVEDTLHVGIAKTEAQYGQNGSWTDVSDNPALTISENCTIYVQVTDRNKNITIKSIYIECFDREKPTVKASRSGRLLRVEARDDLSGVYCIYVDGEEYLDLADGALEVRLDPRETSEERIFIQAKDRAGNLSNTVTITNPYYKEKKETSSSSSRDTDADREKEKETEKEKESSNSKSGEQVPVKSDSVPSQPPGTASAPGSAGASASPEEVKHPGSASGHIIAVGEKQFIIIETKDERVFYLIIDGERSSDNVYLVTGVTTQDLQSFVAEEPDGMEVDGGAKRPSAEGMPDADADTDTLIDGGSLPVVEDEESSVIDGDTADSSMQEDTGNEKEDSENEDGDKAEKKKGNPVLGWLVIGVIVLVLCFGGYMFLVVLPRKKAKEAFLDHEEESDILEESYPDEPDEASKAV